MQKQTQQPLIGITTYARNENGQFMLPAVYVDAVRRAGGIPVLLPPGEDHQEILLHHLDGIILAGGGDISPSYYNGKTHPTIYMVDIERDRSELALIKKLIAKDLPTLCICRGSQILNVALGGSLIEHLPDEVGNDVAHRLPPRERTEHPINLEPTSQLAQIMGKTTIVTASWHHQAVRNLALGLNVVAYAPDGTIEGIEKPDHPWLIGVQWHPELTAATDETQHRLFEALVVAASNH